MYPNQTYYSTQQPQRASYPPPPHQQPNYPQPAVSKTGKLWTTIPQTEAEKEAFLKQCDFIVLIDRSASMKWKGKGEDEKRWTKVQEYMGFIVNAASEYDPDGVDVCFFGTNTKWYKNVESEDKVSQIFKKLRPQGSTNLTEALKETFDRHEKLKIEKSDGNHKQFTCVLVITDGAPDDKASVHKSIARMTKKLSADRFFQCKDSTGDTKTSTNEIGIRFFQVGFDSGATDFLENLDDNLKGAKVDIVDTGNIDELDSNEKVVEAFIKAFFD